MHIDLASMNWLAIISATAAAFILGGIWYGPIFGKAWLNEFGFSEEELGKRHPAKVFGSAILLTFLAAFVMAVIIGSAPSLMKGIHWGLIIGLGPVSMFIGINYVFEQRSVKLFIINALYATLSLVIMGAVIGGMG